MSILPKDPKERKYIMLGFKIVGDVGATIAIPVIVLVLIAQWVEGKYGGGPWLTIFAFIVAALITAKIVVKKAKKYGKEYQELNESNIEIKED